MSPSWRTVLARWLPAALLGIVAFALVLEITDPVAPGLDPDALAYLGSAQSLAAHGEFRTPTARWWNADSTASLAHFPPGYATALALPVRLGMEPIQSSRLVGASSAFVIVFTLVLLVSDAAAPLAGILLAVSLFAMSSMHEVHVSVLSEPLYLAFTVLTLAAMARRPDRPLLAGVAAALGALTRYAGVSLVGAVALWSFARRGTLVTRIRRAVVAAAPAVVTQLLWLMRTRRVAGAQSIRKVAVYGDFGPSLKQAAATFSAWLVPDPDAWQEPLPYRGVLTLAAGALLVAIMAAGAWRLARRRASLVDAIAAADPDDDQRTAFAARLVAAGVLLVACYLAVLTASRVFADPGIPFDERIFSPVILLVSMLAAVCIARWWTTTSSELAKIALVGALMGWWCAAASVTRDEARWALEMGSDFAGEDWRRSGLLDWARAEGARHPLYSNWVAVIYFYLHRPARDVPLRVESSRMAAFVDTLRKHDGRILEFRVPGPEYVTLDSLLKVPGLRVVQTWPDGAVLAPVPVAPAPAPTTPARPRPAAR